MSDDFSWSFFYLHQELQPTYLNIFVPGLYISLLQKQQKEICHWDVLGQALLKG